MKTHSLLMVGGVLSLPLLSVAESTRQLDSHQHGHASLNVAVDEAELLIELESPSANIVGFEHVAKSDADRKTLEAATNRLASADGLFQLDAGAGCSLLASRVEHDQLDQDHSAEHDDHDDDKHGHDDDKHGDDDHDDDKHAHDGDKHDDHDDDKQAHKDDHGHDHDEETHSEFHVVWTFTCKDTGALGSIVVDLFDHFGGIEELDVAVVGLDSQSAAELDADNRRLTL